MFYQKNYLDALNGFEKLSPESNEYQESLRYIFISGLITNLDYSKKVLNYTEENNEKNLYRVYLQLYNVFLNEDKTILFKEDNEIALPVIRNILIEVLKVHEFELFEKLLYVLNYLDTDRVLLELAQIYYNNGFKQMAVKEILRSIKELNAIDPLGVEILYKEIR